MKLAKKVRVAGSYGRRRQILGHILQLNKTYLNHPHTNLAEGNKRLLDGGQRA
jgi:hypothetical protein